MEIERNINGNPVIVDVNSARDIYLSDDLIKTMDCDYYDQNGILNALSKNGFAPLFLHWEIIDKCSMKCPFCYIVGHSSNKVVRFKDMKDHIDNLIDDGMLYCVLSGGEATIHVDFLEIYKHLKSRGVFVEIYTNGYQLTDEMLELFKKYPPYAVEVSIYGIEENDFKRVTGSSYNPSVVLDNIIKMRDSDIIIKCKTPYNKETSSCFEDIREWCKENDLYHYYSTDMYIAYDGEKTEKFGEKIDQSIIYDAIKEREFTQEYGSSGRGSKRKCFSCSVGTYGIHINSNFVMKPCASFNNWGVGFNIKEIGTRKSIDGMLKFISRAYGKDISGCAGCAASHICKMCPALAEPEYGSDGIPISFSTNEKHCNETRKKSSLIDNINNNFIYDNVT